MKLIHVRANHLKEGVVLDETPAFSFAVEGAKQGDSLKQVFIEVNGTKRVFHDQINLRLDGLGLKPHTHYVAHIEAESAMGDEASYDFPFSTGKLKEPWIGKWISDGAYQFTEKKVSPKVMTFRKAFKLKKPCKSATLYATCLGIYEVLLNGQRPGNAYLAPGLTDYKNNLMYQTYDVTSLIKDENSLIFDVCGGWAVGSFVYSRVNRIVAPRQALLAELRIVYEDEEVEIIGTDETFDVSLEGPYKEAEIYDGEVYDSTVDYEKIPYHKASLEELPFSTRISADISAPVIHHEEFKPVATLVSPSGKTIYDFGQNFAGVVEIKIKDAEGGEKILMRHSEILDKGELYVTALRTAKARFLYTAHKGNQTYFPKMTYMGFRYAELSGIDPSKVEVKAYALYSDVDPIGDFSCSDARLNQLHSNTVWGGKSNFVEIPTDCPQRDERMGWTGDIALFAPTACFNFDMSSFLHKWLRDLRSQQKKSGGLPNTIPEQGLKFPVTMPVMAIDFWGDASVMVPFALYDAYGDKDIIETSFDSMKRYVKACKFWANIWGVGKYRYIWHTPSIFHFGDWVTTDPNAPKMGDWQKRSIYTGTASLSNSAHLVSKAAGIVGRLDDVERFQSISDKAAASYSKVFFDEDGKIKKTEFQTAYVLPLAFHMLDKDLATKAVKNLERLLEKDDYCIRTGFPGTPFILPALSDNGKWNSAYKMLLNEKAPSWLYEVKCGATTIWERFDALKEDGTINGGDDGTSGMVSFNHYANGAVCMWMYQHIAGIQMVEPGYKKSLIEPKLGGDITSCEAYTLTPFGRISSSWKIVDGKFEIDVEIPFSTSSTLVLPSGSKTELKSGKYHFSESL